MSSPQSFKLAKVAVMVSLFVGAAVAGHFVRCRAPARSPIPPAESLAATKLAAMEPAPASAPSAFQLRLGIVDELENATSATNFSKLYRDSIHDFRLRKLVCSHWAEIDPKSALEFLQSMPGDKWSDWDKRGLFTTWAATDLESAFAACLTFKESSAQKSAISAALEGGFQFDPRQALSLFFDTKPKLKKRMSSYSTGSWLFQHPEIALPLIQEIAPDDAWALMIRGSMLENWSKRDSAATAAWIQSHPEKLPTSIPSDLFEAFVRADVAAAASYAATLPPKERAEISGVLTAALAKENPASALTWINQNLTGLAQQDTLGDMLERFAAHDPAAAAPYVEDLGSEGRNSGNILIHMMDTWTRTDPSAAIEWAASLDSPALQDEAYSWLGERWANNDRSAAEAFARTAPDAEITPRFLRAIAGQHSSGASSFDDQLEWMLTLPEDRAIHVAGTVIASLASTNSPAAIEALSRFPSTALREAAAQSIVERAAYSDPQALATWLTNAPSEELAAPILDALQSPEVDKKTASRILDLLDSTP